MWRPYRTRDDVVGVDLGRLPQAGMELRRWRAGRARGGERASTEPRGPSAGSEVACWEL
jgi:hypothetical protein